MSHVSAVVRPPLVTGGKSYHDITEDVCRQVEGKPTASWKIVFGISTIVLLLGTASVFWTWWDGLGNWGLNKTVGLPSTCRHTSSVISW